MARSIVQPEMINRTAYRDLQDAGMDASQAEAVAAHLPDLVTICDQAGSCDSAERSAERDEGSAGNADSLDGGPVFDVHCGFGCPADIKQPAGLTDRNCCAVCPVWAWSWPPCSSPRRPSSASSGGHQRRRRNASMPLMTNNPAITSALASTMPIAKDRMVLSCVVP